MATKKHGTYNSYTNGKCRCNLCTNAAREYMRNYRKTAKGRAFTKYYAVLSSRRAQLAAQWVRNNRPDVWESITGKAIEIIGDKPERSRSSK